MNKRRISKLILPLLGIFFLFSANFFAYAEDNKANSLLDNLVTETEYLNDSIFIFSYREKYPDSDGKIVCYPPIKCKILDEDNKTCQLLGCAKISEEWLQELKNGHYYFDFEVRDCPITNVSLQDIDKIPNGLVNGYTVVSIGPDFDLSVYDNGLDGKSMGDYMLRNRMVTLTVLTTRSFEGPIIIGRWIGRKENFKINLVSRVENLPDIIDDVDAPYIGSEKERDKYIIIRFINPCYKEKLPLVGMDFLNTPRYYKYKTQYYYHFGSAAYPYPIPAKVILDWDKSVKDKIAETVRAAYYNEPIPEEDIYLLNWFRAASEEFIEEYDLNLPIPRNIYPHRR
ncbi:MAG: hypothetical protein HDT07_05525 [Bacteroidales bacterium]|nr:hypothetical protein [Bacteroidales bacterium]